jgi:hypothetical protein
MIYILLNLETANHEGAFHSEAEALAEVRDAVERFGREMAVSWALAYWDDADELHAVAEGDALIERAFSVVSAEQPNA